MPKWFRIAKEGATTDGRTISRGWIEQMAATYAPKTYGARIWLEHMRGMFPDGPFKAYGDVLALRTEETEDGELALLAELDPTDDLKQLNEQRQKVYSSIEVDPDFAGTGEAYLVGVAVTDSPASLGTEMLSFSAQQGDQSPLAARKQRPENLFTVAEPVELDFSEDDPAPAGGEGAPTLLDQVKKLFTRHAKSTGSEIEAFRKDLEATMKVIADKYAELEDKAADAEALQTLQAEHAELERRFNELHTQLDNTPDTRHHRTPALGGQGAAIETDC